ncbi:EF-hand domain-containing protein [Haloferula sp.]|uniref:EF-hand domain-containing protein n=1 Tax=Haloferula sp. TaxID=2497595 RepID=UPI0032A13CC2
MNIIRTAILVLMGAGSLLGEPPRRGQGKPSNGGPSDNGRSFGRFFELADTNGDGVVSAEEFSALERISRIPAEKRDEIFKRFDKNGDGLIQRGEMRPSKRPDGGSRPFPKLRELDTDMDGKVSFKEFEVGPFAERMPKDRLEKFFGKLDTNGDGSITPEDRPMGRGGPSEGRGGPGERGPQQHDRKKMIETLDKNDDQALSFEEFRQAPWLKDKSEDEQEDVFEEIDKNDDLVIDKTDLPPGGSKGPRGSGEKGPRANGPNGPRGPRGPSPNDAGEKPE